MQKVLLVDTNFSSLPIYKSLQKMGYEVHVVGANANDCLAKTSPNYHELDYSNVEKLQHLVDKNNFEYLIPGCTDKSYESCAAVRLDSKVGIDSTRVNEHINRKDLFRNMAQELSLPIPKLHAQDGKSHDWPLVVKPVDGFSGHGITVLKQEDKPALAKAIAFAKENSKTKEYLIEDFVDGQLFSHSAFIKKKKVKIDFIVREDRSVNPFVVDTSAVSVDFSQSMLVSIRENVEKIAQHLNLQDGLIHTQFIANEQNYWLIEMTRRCPGDLYSQLVTLSTQVQYTDLYAASFVGRAIEIPQECLAQWVIRHTMTVGVAQSFADISFNSPVKIVKMTPLSLTGDHLKPSPYSRVGIVFFQAQNQDECNALYEKILKRGLYDINV